MLADAAGSGPLTGGQLIRLAGDSSRAELARCADRHLRWRVAGSRLDRCSTHGDAGLNWRRHGRCSGCRRRGGCGCHGCINKPERSDVVAVRAIVWPPARRRCSHARKSPSARPLAPARPTDCADDLPAVPCIVGAGDSDRIGAAQLGSSDTISHPSRTSTPAKSAPRTVRHPNMSSPGWPGPQPVAEATDELRTLVAQRRVEVASPAGRCVVRRSGPRRRGRAARRPLPAHPGAVACRPCTQPVEQRPTSMIGRTRDTDE